MYNLDSSIHSHITSPLPIIKPTFLYLNVYYYCVVVCVFACVLSPRVLPTTPLNHFLVVIFSCFAFLVEFLKVK